MKTGKALTDVIHQLVYDHGPGGSQSGGGFEDNSEWQKLQDAGTELWLDTGDIDAASSLWNSSFKALTTNNTLLNKEVQKGIYDDLVGETAAAIKAAQPDIDEQRLVLEIAFVLNAMHGLKLVELFDAHVSVELHTDLADDADRAVEYARRLYAICPERFIIKIPLAPAGLVAVRRLHQEGIPVNFTLGFSARQNYLAAVFSDPAYVNVFMGRLNAFVADNELGSGENIGEKATLSTQRELVVLREEKLSSSRLIGASMRVGTQVAALAGLDVYTMPVKVAEEYIADPSEEIVNRIADDPEPGLVPAAGFVNVLWEVSDDFRDSVSSLMENKNPDELGSEDLQAFFKVNGFPGFLPEWSEQDIRTVTADGKIPVFDTWQEKLLNGEVGLDALMNISALRAFATDQKALDDRIRSLL
jgi:transaldolase